MCIQKERLLMASYSVKKSDNFKMQSVTTCPVPDVSSRTRNSRFFFVFQLWDIRDGMCKQTFPGHESDINAVTVSPLAIHSRYFLPKRKKGMKIILRLDCALHKCVYLSDEKIIASKKSLNREFR